MTRKQLEKKAREVGVSNIRYESKDLGNYLGIEDIVSAYDELKKKGCESVSIEAEKYYSDPYSDSESIRIVISGNRPATDEELIATIEVQEKLNKERIERDRKQYEELKKRFG